MQKKGKLKLYEGIEEYKKKRCYFWRELIFGVKMYKQINIKRMILF